MKVPCSVVSVTLLRKLPQFYTNLKNVPFAMNENNGIGESKAKQSRCQGESAPELAVGKVLRQVIGNDTSNRNDYDKRRCTTMSEKRGNSRSPARI